MSDIVEGLTGEKESEDKIRGLINQIKAANGELD